MLINRFFSVFRTAARGMEAQRVALGASAENIANVNTSRTEDGTPYQIKRAVHTAPDAGNRMFGNLLSRMQSDLELRDGRHIGEGSLRRPFTGAEGLGPETEIEQVERLRTEYDPTHPHADADGYVRYPDVNLVEEMTRMVSANRLYEANLSAVNAAKEMIKRTLEI